MVRGFTSFSFHCFKHRHINSQQRDCGCMYFLRFLPFLSLLKWSVCQELKQLHESTKSVCGAALRNVSVLTSLIRGFCSLDSCLWGRTAHHLLLNYIKTQRRGGDVRGGREKRGDWRSRKLKNKPREATEIKEEKSVLKSDLTSAIKVAYSFCNKKGLQ